VATHVLICLHTYIHTYEHTLNKQIMYALRKFFIWHVGTKSLSWLMYVCVFIRVHSMIICCCVCVCMHFHTFMLNIISVKTYVCILLLTFVRYVHKYDSDLSLRRRWIHVCKLKELCKTWLFRHSVDSDIVPNVGDGVLCSCMCVRAFRTTFRQRHRTKCWRWCLVLVYVCTCI